MESIKVIKPGFFTTVQDLGRRSFLKAGVSACGAMDPLSLRLANLLVGNEEGAAALEITLVGPRLRFNTDGVIAITGGDLSPTINGEAVPLWKSLFVREGDELGFGRCIDGCRSYVAFTGGIQVPQVMGSRSTFIRGGYGGIEGRALKAGDDIPIGRCLYDFQDIAGRKLPPENVPNYKSERRIRFIKGPQSGEFLPESFESFQSCTYTISNESDRMGYRLKGEPLKHNTGADIISDFITVGSIQVPAVGQPIILMADCQMSGGYTKIGVIISVDIPYVAQKKPGDTMSFQAVEVREAQVELRLQEELMTHLHFVNRLLPKRQLIEYKY